MSSLNPSPSTTSLSTTSGTAINASTETLIPKSASESTQTAGESSTSSTTDTTAGTPTPPVKDYEASFAQLSSSFGFGGMAPTKPPKKNKGKKPASKSFFGRIRSIATPASSEQGDQGGDESNTASPGS